MIKLLTYPNSYINDKPKFSNLNNIDYYDETEIDVSDEFIDIIIKHVDLICEIISNVDPRLQRKTEVNQSLNEAVSCYRIRLLYKQLKNPPNQN